MVNVPPGQFRTVVRAGRLDPYAARQYQYRLMSEVGRAPRAIGEV